MELLQQLLHVRYDRITDESIDAITSIKSSILKMVRETIYSIESIDKHLGTYRDFLTANRPWWKKLSQSLPWKTYVLDPALLNNLKQTAQYLEAREKELRDHLQAYQKLLTKAQESSKKFESYKSLQSLDKQTQEKFRLIYQFLKMWGNNSKIKVLPEKELSTILRSVSTVKQATQIFKTYHKSLHSAFFDLSRSLKEHSAKTNSDITAHKQEHRLKLNAYSQELHSLGSSISRYRDFLLRTDPNPYVRSRWGFSEWVVGPEPSETKELLQVGFEVESLDDQFSSLRYSLLRPSSSSKALSIKNTQHEIQHTLHEMGQPLASKNIMRKRADTLVLQLQEFDELGATANFVVDFVGEVISKALRADWKYHALHEIPEFHKFYQIHLGIIGPSDDESHLERIEQLKHLYRQFRQWAKTGEGSKHANEIEESLNELKGYLQEFLLSLQKYDEALPQDKSEVHEIIDTKRRQLLEYRYEFGNFCHKQGSEVRNQYLFVDQYFEFIENKLNDLETRVNPFSFSSRSAR
jgi:hypothetical protein